MSLIELTLAKLRTSGHKGPAASSPSGSAVPVAQERADSRGQFNEPTRRSPRQRVAVDRAAMRAAGMLANVNVERRIAEEYRYIKRPLLRAAVNPGGNVIMVGSAFSGDGKSFTCVNLCLSLALEKDWHVLLVDADVIKPQISRLFGISGERGLIDALGDASIDPESLIMDTDIPGLAVLPSGRQDDNATELLASARMADVVRRLATGEAHRIVVFDSPPLLQTSEAQVLAGIAGQVAIVVAANRTPRAAVLEAIDLLGSSDNVKLILNRFKSDRSGYYYGGYGYREAVAAQE